MLLLYNILYFVLRIKLSPKGVRQTLRSLGSLFNLKYLSLIENSRFGYNGHRPHPKLIPL
ncbi:MAG: hypothetical protein JWP69_547 [Flaviaesturariibacter sp.]|nr:hypothetical protein [Flaviaesturariibacter sp.]